MTRSELVDRLADRIHLTKKQTEVIVNTFFSNITTALMRGDKVELRGFGNFRVRQRKAREGRNPKTGHTVSIPAKRFPFFKASKDLRQLVNGSQPQAGESP